MPGALRSRPHLRYHRRTSTLSKANATCLTHSSWFRLPDQGMKEYELLARGSGFVVHGPATGTPIAVVSAHVAAPHRFPAYFPHDWLQHVTDADCRSVLETRHEENITGSANHALAVGFRHATLDVAAFLLDTKAQGDLEDVRVLHIDEEAKVGADVSLVGFRLVGASGSGSERLIGDTIHGAVKEIAGSRGFIETDKVESEMGMCGGPIIKNDKCVGLLEGLVPRPRPNDGDNVNAIHARLGGCSVYVGARELRMFLHDVETESARGVMAKG